MKQESNLLKDTLRELPVNNIRLQNLLLKKYRACFPGSGTDFDRLRVYIPGDSVKDIDWRTTARFNTTYVRTYLETFDNNVLFAIDTSSSMNFFDKYGNSKVKNMLAAVFFMANTALKNGDKIGFFYRLHDNYIFRPFSNAPGVLRGELSNLGNMVTHSFLDEQDWDEFLDNLNKKVKKPCICFIVSDNLNFHLSTISKLKIASLKHKLLFIELTNWFDVLSPSQEDLVVTDIETGETFDWFLDDPKLIEALQKEKADQLAASPIVLKIPARHIEVSDLHSVIFDMIRMLSGRETVLTRHLKAKNE